ncbi:hypothetical protein XENOCAPTIV_015225 [Xenoophorus captivus]|uniref:Uncharacterized protein n=1 Tax=Xenoophorus captivus TaxID=1517983 RepID=A0ABV0SA25_9TELE
MLPLDPAPYWMDTDNRASSQVMMFKSDRLSCSDMYYYDRCNRILRNMEASLTARDRVGIQDFVLLDPYTSESAFLDNLRKRFHENLIYVGVSCAAHSL